MLEEIFPNVLVEIILGFAKQIIWILDEKGYLYTFDGTMLQIVFDDSWIPKSPLFKPTIFEYYQHKTHMQFYSSQERIVFENRYNLSKKYLLTYNGIEYYTMQTDITLKYLGILKEKQIACDKHHLIVQEDNTKLLEDFACTHFVCLLYMTKCLFIFKNNGMLIKYNGSEMQSMHSGFQFLSFSAIVFKDRIYVFQSARMYYAHIQNKVVYYDILKDKWFTCKDCCLQIKPTKNSENNAWLLKDKIMLLANDGILLYDPLDDTWIKYDLERQHDAILF